MEKQIKKNILLYLIVLGITLIFGIFFVYSSLFAMEELNGINPKTKLLNYIIAMTIGTVGGIISFVFGKVLIKSKSFMISMYIFLNSFLFIVLFFSHNVANVNRWLYFGSFQFQPSELAKLLIPAIIAHYYYIKTKSNFLFDLLIPVIICGIPIFLIYKEPDLSTSVIISFISIISIFLAIKKFKYQSILILTVITITIFAFIFKDNLLHSYQLQRLNNSDNYQTQQSLKAIENGGVLGTSPFNGKYKYRVPASYSDFIMSVIGEEWGKLGIILVITLFLFLSWNLITMAYTTKNLLTIVYSCTTAMWIFVQVTINALVGLGVKGIPVTGVTLPLMSYGNTSLIITLTAIGLSLGLIYFNSLGSEQIEKN
ncbi:cell division protein FtsW [Tepiditoga spiralis]|uniref:Probable peptidoglycan glycosyltransferase FtsW n=1 Tax=Tepiditoga spiralis TaxID=2108365 RepID=A0A7G1G6D3_9BACT|nr:FtsW/RodA/SpoVE family cell cycle protein [Tepiditoga spiralis]BBE30373.1 cell division protein FtsW [Tepiditoga spiralis]